MSQNSRESSVQAVVDGILNGRILATLDRYYAPDVVMSENGVEFHAASVGRKIVAGDQAAIEWIFEFTPNGDERVTQKQVAMQTWRDGNIVREDLYHG